MFGFQIDQAKGLFFDSKAVTSRVDTATRRVLSRFGAFVRTRSRTSIRKRKGVSDPGQPPSSHLGLLKQWILFFYDPEKKSVIIGPARLNGRIGNAPEALEHGGESESRTVSRRRGTSTRRTSVRPRPFMQPAFEKELPGVPKMWENSVKP